MNVLLCMGTRPDIVNLAPVYHALLDAGHEPFVLQVGGTADDDWSLFDFFGIAPDHCLDLKLKRATASHLSAVLIDRLDALLACAPVGAVLVHGASPAALAAALAAYAHGLPVGHLEAALPSPAAVDYPAFTNRRLISQLAWWHFATSPRLVKLLQLENCHEGRIFYVRNPVVDAVRWGAQHLHEYFAHAESSAAFPAEDLARWLQAGRMLLINAPARPAAAAGQIAAALGVLLRDHPDLRIVWPGGARIPGRSALQALPLAAAERLILLDPVGYPQTLWLMKHAALVLTGASMLQEEAATLKVPALLLRRGGEAAELVEAGGAAWADVQSDAIALAVRRLLHDSQAYRAMRGAENPFGYGRSGRHIAAILQRDFDASQPARRPHLPAPAPPTPRPSVAYAA